MSVTWTELVDGVKEMLLEDGQRDGYGPIIERLMRTAAVDLQRVIPRFRKWHTTLIPYTKLIEDGSAQLATLPEGIKQLSKVTVVCSPEDTEGEPAFNIDLDLWPWEDRNTLITGVAMMYDNERGYYAVSPDQSIMTVWPALTSLQNLMIEYDGRKLVWAPSEPVSFTPVETVMEAMAYYVKARLNSLGEGDNDAKNSNMTEYLLIRRSLFTG